jgi:hypothetical protein
MPTGRGVRCFGFVSDDGAYAHCTREELSGGMAQHKDATYVHRLAGPCKCGTTHGEAVIPIGAAAREIVATYDYRDAAGRLAYQVVRFRPKDFRQRRPDGAGWTWKLDGVEPLLYRLPDVVSAVAAGDVVYVCEGEKDVEFMFAAGCVATCNSGGAGKWPKRGAEWLAGADVVIVRDKDEPGTKHAREVFAALKPVAKSLRVVEARAGKDAADHLAAKHTPAEFVPVYPVTDLRATDPIAWKRRVLRMSFDSTDPIREIDPLKALAGEDEPHWPTGLAGWIGDKLPHFRGVVIVAGLPSSGKSYLSIASGVCAACSGWDVLYLSCEMAEKPFAKRLHAYMDPLPEAFHYLDVGYGVTVEGLVDWIEARLTARPTLVVFDSVSSFCDQVAEQYSEDAHGLALLKRIIMWAINARRATHGEIAFLLLAEASKEGRARGRFADHKADLALLMESIKDRDSVKRVTVTKAWEAETGIVGEFGLDITTARLVRI